MNKNILLGVAGGIAAYKSANIISKLKKQGYNVRVIMTKNACEIITPLTLETLARDRVVVDMWDKKAIYDVEHISLGDWADLILVAPATYNIVGKIANGIADDMLSTVISASKAPIFFALAMNVNMYENPILKENIEKLNKYKKYNFIEADEGFLACNYSAKGRLKDEDEIIDEINSYFMNKEILKNKKILITGGRTEEKLDPIRFFSNKSTGKMAYSIAQAAKNLGAEVILVAGPNEQRDIKGITTIHVKSAIEMFEACTKEFENIDIFIACAAVADYRPKDISEHKIKKSNDKFIIEMERNPDILKELSNNKGNKFFIGFCAESENLIENAKNKLKNKNLDIIVANNVKYMGSDKNNVTIIDREFNIFETQEAKKEKLAYEILNFIK